MTELLNYLPMDSVTWPHEAAKSNILRYDPQIRTWARFSYNAPRHQVSSSCV